MSVLRGTAQVLAEIWGPFFWRALVVLVIIAALLGAAEWYARFLDWRLRPWAAILHFFAVVGFGTAFLVYAHRYALTYRWRGMTIGIFILYFVYVLGLVVAVLIGCFVIISTIVFLETLDVFVASAVAGSEEALGTATLYVFFWVLLRFGLILPATARGDGAMGYLKSFRVTRRFKWGALILAMVLVLLSVALIFALDNWPGANRLVITLLFFGVMAPPLSLATLALSWMYREAVIPKPEDAF